MTQHKAGERNFLHLRVQGEGVADVFPRHQPQRHNAHQDRRQRNPSQPFVSFVSLWCNRCGQGKKRAWGFRTVTCICCAYNAKQHSSLCHCRRGDFLLQSLATPLMKPALVMEAALLHNGDTRNQARDSSPACPACHSGAAEPGIGAEKLVNKRPLIVVVMPAYNAARTLERTYHDIPPGTVDHVILVDDVSQDTTVEVAQRLGLHVVIHMQNRGYGGNQKTCYLEALKAGADIVVMLHPDYQYDSTRIPALIAPIQAGKCDMMLGSRLLGTGHESNAHHHAALQGGMPVWKYIANRFLTMCENAVLGQHLSECHTGFRAYSRQLLETVPFLLNSDDFVFDTEMIVQAVAFGFRIGEIAVPTRYFEEASSVNFPRSVVYGTATLRVLLRYLLHRTRIRKYPQFSQCLAEILSPYHSATFLRSARQ